MDDSPNIDFCYWSISSGVLNTANDTGWHFEVLFFCKKYINKASAGGTRRMCTFSHVRVCRTQTYRQAHTSHTPLFRTGEATDLVQDQCSTSHPDPDLGSVESQVIRYPLKTTSLYLRWALCTNANLECSKQSRERPVPLQSSLMVQRSPTEM